MQHKYLPKFFYLFALFFIFSVPFPHKYIPDIAGHFHPFSEAMVKFTGNYIFKIDHPYISQLISDSTGLYIHVFNLTVICIIISLIWMIADTQKKNYKKLFYWFSVIITYYLALQLFEYGFSKIFKWQFYLPEPNTLFTTVGNTYRDLMYWNTMGLSRPYTIFAGITEIIAACLLLFKRTRLAGALLAFFVLTNVVVINFSYDISVKILSCFLLLLSMIIIAPYAANLFSFLFNRKINETNEYTKIYIGKWIYVFSKTFVIFYMLFSTMSIYFAENNFNDDLAQRPPLHGAYETISFIRNNDSIPPLLSETTRWRRVFVHRKNYFIIQGMNDEMIDYALVIDTINRTFILTDEETARKFTFDYNYSSPDSTLKLWGKVDNDSLTVQLKQIDLKQLPALQQEYRWTVDP